MALQPGSLNKPSFKPLPAILCLHGGGTNHQIFNIQAIRLQRLLSSSFDFFFLDGPFQSPPGPGVLPVFEGCGPFLRWIKIIGEDGIPDETRKVVDEALKERDFVGVMGFSQGAKLASGLLFEQQLAKKKSPGIGGFKFGVLLCGTSPPLTSALAVEEKTEIISIPAVHVVGLQDPWRDSSREMFEKYFDKESSKKLEFDIGHHLPSAENETAKIADEILRLYKETSGR